MQLRISGLYSLYLGSIYAWFWRKLKKNARLQSFSDKIFTISKRLITRFVES